MRFGTRCPVCKEGALTVAFRTDAPGSGQVEEIVSADCDCWHGSERSYFDAVDEQAQWEYHEAWAWREI